MGRSRIEDGWLEDFSIVLRPDAIRSLQRKPGFEVFAGSKVLADLWLAAVAASAGALAGMCAGPDARHQRTQGRLQDSDIQQLGQAGQDPAFTLPSAHGPI